MKRNEMIDEKVENLFMNTVFPKKNQLKKDINLKRHLSMPVYLRMDEKKIGLKFCKIKNHKTLKSPYLYQVQ
jgi:hypothetical protein